MKPRLGIIGFGVIGGYLYRRITSAGDAAVIFVYHADRGKTAGVPRNSSSAPRRRWPRGGPRGGGGPPQGGARFRPTVLRQADFLPLSLTAFCDDLFRK